MGYHCMGCLNGLPLHGLTCSEVWRSGAWWQVAVRVMAEVWRSGAWWQVAVRVMAEVLPGGSACRLPQSWSRNPMSACATLAVQQRRDVPLIKCRELASQPPSDQDKLSTPHI
eukprot:365091-Chlamydomonas_euryale.AAC.26